MVAGQPSVEGEEKKNRYENIENRAAIFITPEITKRTSFHLGGDRCCFSRGGCFSDPSSDDPRRRRGYDCEVSSIREVQEEYRYGREEGNLVEQNKSVKRKSQVNEQKGWRRFALLLPLLVLRPFLATMQRSDGDLQFAS